MTARSLTLDEMREDESRRPMAELPGYEIAWRPDINTRRSGWWSIKWSTPLPRVMSWRVNDSGYAWSRKGAEREARRIVDRVNRGLRRADWSNA